MAGDDQVFKKDQDAVQTARRTQAATGYEEGGEQDDAEQAAAGLRYLMVCK
jgi:hypothetical protein